MPIGYRPSPKGRNQSRSKVQTKRITKNKSITKSKKAASSSSLPAWLRNLTKVSYGSIGVPAGMKPQQAKKKIKQNPPRPQHFTDWVRNVSSQMVPKPKTPAVGMGDLRRLEFQQQKQAKRMMPDTRAGQQRRVQEAKIRKTTLPDTYYGQQQRVQQAASKPRVVQTTLPDTLIGQKNRYLDQHFPTTPDPTSTPPPVSRPPVTSSTPPRSGGGGGGGRGGGRRQEEDLTPPPVYNPGGFIGSGRFARSSGYSAPQPPRWWLDMVRWRI